jgi:hypothetical protein
MEKQILTYVDHIQKMNSNNEFYNLVFYCENGGCEEQSQSGYTGSYFCDGCSMSITKVED